MITCIMLLLLSDCGFVNEGLLRQSLFSRFFGIETCNASSFNKIANQKPAILNVVETNP